MNIVIYSSTFHPNIGGLEQIMHGLAYEWVNTHFVQVTVVTETKIGKEESESSLPYRIRRRIRLFALIREVQRADIYVEANISLKTVFVGLLFKKKWFVIHHVPYHHQNTLTGRIKNQLTKFTNNIAVSSWVKAQLLGYSTVINNFYAPYFTLQNDEKRQYDIGFVGRFVSDKGIIELVELLLKVSLPFKAALVGDGPLFEKIKVKVHQANAGHKIILLGSVVNQNLVPIYNQIQNLVIPALWDEPFGVIALEGLACGCNIISTKRGGLEEATGGYATFIDFNNRETTLEILNDCIRGKYNNKINYTAIQKHLSRHTQKYVASRYIEFMTYEK